MGAAKELLIQMDDMRAEAESVAVDVGAVVRCEFHDDVLISQYDDDALTQAYKLANARISRGEIVLPSMINRRDFSDLIKEVVDQSGDECYSCAKMFAD
jgi:hypothetical protein